MKLLKPIWNKKMSNRQARRAAKKKGVIELTPQQHAALQNNIKTIHQLYHQGQK